MADPKPATVNEFDLRAQLRVLVRFRWLIVACTVVIATVVILWTIKQPRVYEASAIIEYDPTPQRPLGADVPDVADPIGGYLSSREFFATQNQIIGSRTIAERVVRRLGLHEDPSYWGNRDASGFVPLDPGDAAVAVLERLTVAQVKDTRLVHIQVRDHKPERAKAIADAFADVYIEKTMEDRMGSTISALEWLGGQLDQLRRDLDASELALHQFKEDHNVLSVSMEDRQNLVAGEIQALSGALTEVRQRRIAVAARVARVQSALGRDPVEQSGIALDERSGLQSLREVVRTKLAERERLATRYGPAHPQMSALDEEIRALQEQLRQEVETVVRGAEADLLEVRSIESGLAQALETAHAAGLTLNLREIEYRRLSREQANKEKLYQLVLQRTTETDLTRMLQTTHARLVDRARVPKYPVAPNRTLNAILGTFGGLLFGILLAFGIRMLDRAIRSAEAIEELGVTVVGVLPEIGDDAKSAERGRTRRRGARSVPELIVHEFPMSAAAECCRMIRTNLTFMSLGENAGRAFVVTSSLPREGKTTVASNLAATIAQADKRVLLIDTDLRKPRVHEAFRLSRERGVSSFVVGSATFEEIVQSSFVPGLDIITSGPVPPNPAELLLSGGFEKLLRTAREEYDVVILDTPPLGAVTDAAIVGPKVDGVLVVVRANATTLDALASTLRQLRDVNARILGAIVNGLDLSKDGYYGRGYYYRRYGEYYESEGALERAAAE